MSARRRTGAAPLLAAAIVLFTSAASSSTPRAAAPGDELPDAPAKKILLRACTTCHDLDEVTKFEGYYTRAQWRDIVVTMREYGAALEDGEIEPLTDYLFAAVGKKE